MFAIEMLPAREGDCLWIRYGSKIAPKQVLVDAGRAATYESLRARLAALPPGRRTFELFVVTHVDRDHIEGAMRLLEDTTLKVTFKEVWFNGYHHLKSAKLESFGAVMGERVTAALLAIAKKKWNKRFDGKAVALRGETLPKVELDGGLVLTLLSPDKQKLLDLLPTWEKECKEAGIVAGKPAKPSGPAGLEEFGAIDVEQLASAPFHPDATRANGSSIAFLAQYDGKRALLAADAHEDRLVASIARLAKGKRLKLDLLKVPHHGSEGNLSRRLLEAIDCPTYLVSTNGSYFKHPRAIAISRILEYGGPAKTIAFNYRSKFTEVWDSASLQQQHDYRALYPAKADNGTLTVDLS